ncbi:hypothetical protein ACJQWK_06704 [Exserohilum turcicum]
MVGMACCIHKTESCPTATIHGPTDACTPPCVVPRDMHTRPSVISLWQTRPLFHDSEASGTIGPGICGAPEHVVAERLEWRCASLAQVPQIPPARLTDYRQVAYLLIFVVPMTLA